MPPYYGKRQRGYPVEDFALVPTHYLVDVVLNDLLQLSLVADGGYPRRELRVPDYHS